MNLNNTKPYLYLLASMYLAGIIGLSIPYTRLFFQFLTPFHLLSSFILLIIFQSQKAKSFWFFVIFCILFGYVIEVLGVKTGLIFGKYSYLETLGFKIFDVPPLIGFNWFLMVFSVGTLINSKIKQIKNPYHKAILGAVILTLFDYIAEPVAIQQNMWQWYGLNPPLQNYVAWFLVAFLLLICFFKLPFKKENPLASYLFAFQFLFFFVLRMLII